MPQLILHREGETVTLPFEGTVPLSALLGNAGCMPETPCGGAGICGKCLAFGTGAFCPAPDEAGRILTCQTAVSGDAELFLQPHRTISRIQTDGALPIGSIAPGRSGYAAAVDIGTTTVAARLVNLADGTLYPPVSVENPQRLLAADVIGRIQMAMDGKLEILRGLIQEAVNDLLRQACEPPGITPEDLAETVITGNTTMLYLYTGRDPKALSRAPFLADCLFGFTEEGVTYPPCYGAFVGADIYTAVLASDMCREGETALLVDLGTNGEIALWHEGKLTCCATAAGPAFEGSGIRCGGAAVEGAIDHVFCKDGTLSYTTIGQKEAVCLCGSGLIDLIACLLQQEIIDETGAMDDDCYSLCDAVSLYQEDIRQVQLAKGAISAGIQTLLTRAGLSAKDVDTFYIAGGFGSYLDLHSAAQIGLFPAVLKSKARVLGNAALGGAVLQLLDPQGSAESDALCLNLAECPEFTDLFMEAMFFE